MKKKYFFLKQENIKLTPKKRLIKKKEIKMKLLWPAILINNDNFFKLLVIPSTKEKKQQYLAILLGLLHGRECMSHAVIFKAHILFSLIKL
jgi:hypothetical protein